MLLEDWKGALLLQVINLFQNYYVMCESLCDYVSDADLDPLLQFTFSKSPPEYMWYDNSDNSKSHNPFVIGCEGSYTSGNTNVVFQNSVMRVPNTVASSGDDVVYDFGSSFTSDKSGVYQCVVFNTPDKDVLYQQTTNVIITG